MQKRIADPFRLGARLFLAGDVRANEQADLTVVHTLFVREHNRLADRIHDLYPGLNDEQVYLLSPSVPGGLQLGNAYYVVESSANSFKLSRTKAGVTLWMLNFTSSSGARPPNPRVLSSSISSSVTRWMRMRTRSSARRPL